MSRSSRRSATFCAPASATTRAAEVYTKAVEKIGEPDRSHWTLFYFRGTAYERAKQWQKAEADLKKALELVPDNQPNGKPRF